MPTESRIKPKWTLFAQNDGQAFVIETDWRPESGKVHEAALVVSADGMKAVGYGSLTVEQLGTVVATVGLSVYNGTSHYEGAYYFYDSGGQPAALEVEESPNATLPPGYSASALYVCEEPIEA